MVVFHAPVLVPTASTNFAASGMDECTKPAARPSTRTLRGRCGLAGALSGSAAIIFSTSAGQGTCGLALWPPHAAAGFGGGAGGGGIAAVSPAVSSACVSAPVRAVSQVVYQPSKVALNSSRLTAPSLLVSVAVKTAAPPPPRPPPRPGVWAPGAAPAGGCC